MYRAPTSANTHSLVDYITEERLGDCHGDLCSQVIRAFNQNIITAGDTVLDGESLLYLYLHSEIWRALQDAHIDEHIKTNSMGLSALVEESGKDISGSC